MPAINLGYLYALLCVLLWSFIPVVSRFGQSYLDSFQFLFWSNCLSLIVVAFFMLIKKGTKPLKEFSLMKILYVLFLGGLGCAFYYLCLYYGYANGQGMEVLVIQYSWPLLIIALSAFILSERLTLKAWIAVFTGFIGIMIVLIKGNLLEVQFTNLTVSAFVLLGAFSFALFSVLSKKFQGEPYTVTTLLFVGGLLLSTISLFIFSDFQMPHKEELIPVIINGALINGISYIFWLKALEKVEASITAVLVFLAPVLSSIWIVLFFQKPFYKAYGVGLILVLESGYVCVKSARKKHPQTKKS